MDLYALLLLLFFFCTMRGPLPRRPLSLSLADSSFREVSLLCTLLPLEGLRLGRRWHSGSGSAGSCWPSRSCSLRAKHWAQSRSPLLFSKANCAIQTALESPVSGSLSEKPQGKGPQAANT